MTDGATVAPASPPAPFYSDAWLDLWQGEAAEVLAALPAGSVHAIITSPPYWGLRDYGTAEWTGGTDPDCDHRPKVQPRGDRPAGKLHGGFATVTAAEGGRYASDVCRQCGATRADRQLGLERSPFAYVDRLVAILREARRVLRDDGLLWLNLGDSFAGKGGTSTTGPGAMAEDSTGYAKWDRDWRFRDDAEATPEHGARNTAGNRDGAPAVRGLQPKDLVGIPWRVAFALQEDGWRLRRDVVWAKPNPMPESVTDRPTSSHEYVFMLAKAGRYYFDAEAVAEPSLSGPSDLRKMAESRDRQTPLRPGDPHGEHSNLARKRGVGGRWPGIGPQHGAERARGEDYEAGMEARPTRNIRSVWTIATVPYRGAHFAAFPPALVRPMILASTSERGCCPSCGGPWRRVLERTTLRQRNPTSDGGGPKHRALVESGQRSSLSGLGASNSHNEATPQTAEVRTVGWRPTCDHYPRTDEWRELPKRLPDEDDDAYEARIAPDVAHRDDLLATWAPLAAANVPAVVMDPFAGTGTVGMVAAEQSRRSVLVDLNAEYLRDHALRRNAAMPLGL